MPKKTISSKSEISLKKRKNPLEERERSWNPVGCRALSSMMEKMGEGSRKFVWKPLDIKKEDDPKKFNKIDYPVG